MSVNHKGIYLRLEANEGDNAFVEEMIGALNRAIDIADSQGTTVDWATLTIEPSDQIETYTADGQRQFYSLGLELRVDSISIEEDE